MAKLTTLQFFKNFDDDVFQLKEMRIVSADPSRVVVRDADTGARMIFEGEGLKVRGDAIVRGTLEGVEGFAKGGRPVFDVSKFELNIRALENDSIPALFQSFSESIFERPLKVLGSNGRDDLNGTTKDDVMFGRGGDDQFSAGAGNDRMTGGAGNDVFDFVLDQGRDVITDFDANGRLGNQDLLGGSFIDVTSVEQKGRDTVIEFESGDRFVLADVKATQIDESDFLSFYL